MLSKKPAKNLWQGAQDRRKNRVDTREGRCYRCLLWASEMPAQKITGFADAGTSYCHRRAFPGGAVMYRPNTKFERSGTHTHTHTFVGRCC